MRSGEGRPVASRNRRDRLRAARVRHLTRTGDPQSRQVDTGSYISPRIWKFQADLRLDSSASSARKALNAA